MRSTIKWHKELIEGKWKITDDNGTEYQDDGSADSYFYDTVVGGSKIAPKQHRAGSIYMISNNKFSVNNVKFNVSEIWANDDDKIGDGGVAQLNQYDDQSLCYNIYQAINCTEQPY